MTLPTKACATIRAKTSLLAIRTSDLLAPRSERHMLKGSNPLAQVSQVCRGRRDDDLLVLQYSDFEHEEPLVFAEDGVYVETDVSFKNTAPTPCR